ncbi:hypothetical protein [Alishewanella sp. HL-SH06]|uniref:hypothetical protein n=1 Tax=Alishewanella sp. HL-SH06 TaxID=3461144 RepID=UPI0040437498
MLRTDLKIFKSQRMTQNANAGGQRTSNEVTSGQLNEVFGNISAIDHAQSAVDIVKVYPAVSTANTALLQDGHVLINEPPVDPLVDVIMVESAAITDSSTRADIINVIESGVTAGLLLRSGLSEMVPGQNLINALDLSSGNAGTNEQLVVSLTPGTIIAISVEYTGTESTTYPRFTHYAKVVSSGTGSNVVFSPGIPFITPGRDTPVNSQTRCTKLRATTQNDAVTYHGSTELTSPVSAGGQTLAVAHTNGQLLPKLTQAVIRSDNTPFESTDGLNRSELIIPATGVNYVVEIPSVADLDGNNTGSTPAFKVNYVVGGTPKSRSYSISNYSNGQFSFNLSELPDAGSEVFIYYFDGTTYEMWSNQNTIPVGYTVVSTTLRGTISNGSSLLTAQWRNDGVYAQTGQFTWMLAALIDSSGAVAQYVNGYNNLSYTAVIINGAASGQTTTTVDFVLDYSSILTDTLYITAQLAAGGTVSASADSSGVISGVGVTGTISNSVVSLTFTNAIIRSSINYTVTELQLLTPPAALFGINQLRLINNGNVPLFRQYGVLSISHTEYQTADLPNGTVLQKRPDAFVDIVDSTGASLWHPLDQHFSYDKTTGEITIIDSSSFTGPFEITDTISELAQVSSVNSNTIALTTPLAGSYPAGSVISSVQVLGNMQAAANVLFDMTTWANEWSDVITGTAANGNYNELNYPVEVENRSAINERWVIIFTSGTAFRCIGEGVGQIATGDTLNDFAPINPNTNQPYFVIRQQGWGGGWNAGECVRFNTEAAAKPLVLLRAVSAGHSQIEQDSIRLHFRGNAD